MAHDRASAAPGAVALPSLGARIPLPGVLRPRLATVAKVGVFAIVIGLLAWRIDWSGSFGGLDRSSILPLALALVAFTLSAALKAVIWAGLLRGLPDGAGVRSRELLSPVFIGLMGNWIAPARLGEAARVVVARRRLVRRGVDLDVPAVTGGAAGELLVSTGAWAVVALVAALALPVPGYVTVIACGAVATVAVMLLIAVRGRPVPADRPVPTSRTGRLLRGARESLAAGGQGLRRLRAPRALAVVAGAGLAAIALQWVATFLVLEALGIHVGLGGAAAVLVTTTIAQTVPLLPGGLGSYQAAVSLPLVASYGVAGLDAIAVALLLHASQALTGIGPGLAFLAREDIDRHSLRRLDAEAAAEAG